MELPLDSSTEEFGDKATVTCICGNVYTAFVTVNGPTVTLEEECPNCGTFDYDSIEPIKERKK